VPAAGRLCTLLAVRIAGQRPALMGVAGLPGAGQRPALLPGPLVLNGCRMRAMRIIRATRARC